MADGRVEFEIIGNDTGINTSIKKVTENIKSESKKWDQAAGNAADEAAGSWVGAVAKIAGALSAAGVVSILSNWGKAAISAASDLAEVQNVVDVTFGDSSAQIESWSKQAGKAFGLTETQAKRYTSTIGAMLKSQGMADDEIVKMSTDLAGLAADMASFYNLDFDTAFQKIRSGISGETEPLKQLGVNMSAANLEAFRLAQGIEKSYTAMSQSEQTALRYQYIMQATADAQGDFARTADGFANASRRVETAMETIKTKGGWLLMEVVEPLVSGVADLLTELTTVDTSVLDTFESIDKSTSEKTTRIKQTADDARYMADELDRLSNKTSLTDDEQRLWLETLKRLEQTIPGLSSIINTETGEINGGTTAVREYVKAWEEGQKKLAYLKAHQAKKDALDEAFADLPQLDVDAMLAESRTQPLWEGGVKDIFEKYGFNLGYSSKTGKIDRAQFRNATKEERKLLNEWADAWDKYGEAKNLFDKRSGEYDAALALFKEEEDFLSKLPGDIDNVTDSTKDLTDAQKKAADATEKAKTAFAALADYVQSVHDATERTVDSIVKGFDKIQRPTTEMEEKRSKLIEQQNALNRSTKDGEKRYQELQKQIDSLNASMSEYTPKGMQDALKSQIAFMDEYLKNLDKAKAMGLSDELLASLSDGSVQSAEYLTALVSDPEQAKQIDALYQEVQAKKQGFTDALTEQKLSADDTYASLVDTAKTAIAEMDQGAEAQTAMENTVAGLAKGISDKVPEVRDAVNAILAELNRLSGFGINVSIPGFGSFPESSVTFKGASAAPAGVNYDLFGDLLKTVKPGGNVYLDGRKVGSVISEQQGNAYRSQTRSGFQQ